MLRSTYPLALTAALLFAASPLLAQEDPASAQDEGCGEACAGFAPGYLTFSGQYRVGSKQYDKDITAFVGWLVPRGEDGTWMIRAEAGGGISLYSPDSRNFGFLGGAQLGLMRVWTGDYLGLSDGLPIELFISAGAGAFAGRHLEESPDETVLVPTVTGGIGFRARSRETGGNLVTVELLGEESIGDRRGRAFLRVSVGWAR